MKIHESIFTHALPGITLGGCLVALLLIHNIWGAMFNNLPILLSLGVFFYGLIWLIHSVIYEDNKDGAKVVPSLMAVVGLTFFVITWCVTHYIPAVPVSCSAHGGFLRSSTSLGKGHEYRSDETIVHIICKDGFTFFNVQ